MLKFIFIILTIFISTHLHAIDQKTFQEIMIKNCSEFSSLSTCSQSVIDLDQLKSKTLQIIQKDAPKLDVDQLYNLDISISSDLFIRKYYCYYNYKNLFDLDQFGPDLFAFTVQGVTFAKKSLTEYSKWLHSKKSIKCKSLVKQFSNSDILQIDSRDFNKREYLIILNPITYFEFGTDQGFNNTLLTVFNHERLHIVYDHSKNKSRVRKFIQSRPAKELKLFTDKYSTYRFEIPSILDREFFSYNFQHFPLLGIDFLSGNFKFSSISELEKKTCHWCINRDSFDFDGIKTLAKLQPKELLSKIESLGIKVKILHSNRPATKYFSWGSIRQDGGDISDISKIEGSLGKTLCKGERDASRDELTIVLTADSPYSTLIHEYMHYLQIQNEPSWCYTSKELWSKKKISPNELKMVRDREWDVRIALWKLIDSPQFNIEDKILMAEGILREGKLREEFDPGVRSFIEVNHVSDFLQKQIELYQKK